MGAQIHEEGQPSIMRECQLLLEEGVVELENHQWTLKPAIKNYEEQE
jgi:hypothetical protein